MANGYGVGPDETASGLTYSRPAVSASAAQSVIAAALDGAAEMGIAVAVVVLDPHGRTTGVLRMDGAPVLSVDIASGKALAVVGMGGAPSTHWQSLGADDPSFAGAFTSIRGIVPFGGGEPLLLGGQLVGSVGVSGGTVDEDVAVARRATSVLAGHEAAGS